MKPVFLQTQLYTFLLYCNGSEMDKKILDCGAGGKLPPLAIFKEHGYETYGIDISDKQIEFAKEFERKYYMNLNIKKGNMLAIPFDDESISFVYSYNSIFHMSKEEIRKVIKEIHRVLPQNGLAFINFATIHDWRYKLGEKVRDGEYLQEEHGEKILHSYFEVDEPEKYFNNFKVIYKENRIREGFARDGAKITRGYVDYIIKKI